MSLNDPLANVLSQIYNSDIKGLSECTVSPASKIVLSVLKIMRDNKYIGEFTVVTENRGGLIKVNLLGNVNKCGVVKPRFSFTKKNIEFFGRRFLPAKGFGLFIVSTSQGIMTHTDALDKKIGGRLVAYCY